MASASFATARISSGEEDFASFNSAPILETTAVAASKLGNTESVTATSIGFVCRDRPPRQAPARPSRNREGADIIYQVSVATSYSTSRRPARPSHRRP